MNVLLFHLMPYADLDLNEAKNYQTVWATLPNRLYDPKKGHALYNRYLDELEYGEQLGFDGLCVNEHHQTAYGMMPSPIVTAAALARRTSKARIAILGSALPLRTHPLTVAEEHAMIDNITGGRLISGFVRGIGAEYHIFGVNPTFSLERFQQAHDLIVRAWTEPGPFEYHSKHYHFEYVNLWPRPYQQPHPPVWIPSQGSRETIEFAAHPAHKYTYLQTFSPIKAVARYLQMYKDVAQGFGYAPSPRQLGWAVPVYVGDTDQSAFDEAKVHFEVFRNTYLKMPFEMLLPPGYTSRESMKGMAAAKAQLTSYLDTKSAMDMGMFICGSAKTVLEQLKGHAREVGFGNLLTMLQFGTLPADLTRRNMERFAHDVMPELKKASRAMHGDISIA
ncbi:MAG: LLM class flavin-dependent oxidoreductase [Betaproteobacteria bacterium]|nr:LLM class flavin-dependent oxidoreductase [Betaproteobacteria bacterium]